MKLSRLAVLIALVVAACKGPSTTEVNRTPVDAGNRRLVLRTSFSENSGIPFAAASFRDGERSGFGQGVLITCNGLPIVDTRKSGAVQDTGRFITFPSFSYDWKYQGPDTSFEVFVPVQTETVIDSLLSDGSFFTPSISRTDSCRLVYHPMSECWNLQAVLFTNSATLFPRTVFDPGTGEVFSIHPEELNIPINSSSGSMALAKVMGERFRTNSISSIEVSDSTIGRTFFFIWR
jgi:hypothetical protein